MGLWGDPEFQNGVETIVYFPQFSNIIPCFVLLSHSSQHRGKAHMGAPSDSFHQICKAASILSSLRSCAQGGLSSSHQRPVRSVQHYLPAQWVFFLPPATLPWILPISYQIYSTSPMLKLFFLNPTPTQYLESISRWNISQRICMLIPHPH